MDAEKTKQILSRPIELADQVTKMADLVYDTFRQESSEMKAKTEKLAALLRQAARASNDLYERPMRRIMDDTEQSLEKSMDLVMKCKGSGCMKRLFTIIPNAAFRKASAQLENSIGNVSWLLRVSCKDERDDEYLGLPPIAANEPILCLIWEQVAILEKGSPEERADAAASLVSLARDNDRYGKLIVEEGGIPPLLKLAKEGRREAQESAVKAIGLLGRDPYGVEEIVNSGACQVFAKILKHGRMKIQSTAAWAVAEMAENNPSCQDHFAQSNIIRLLVSHLAFETIREHSKYAVANRHGSQPPLSLHSAASQIKTLIPNSNHIQPHPTEVLPGTSIKGREYEDPETKARMKAMAAKALWKLSIGNSNICHSITESRALLCFAVLLDRGDDDDVRFNSAMAVMEISSVAEQNPDLRRSAFKPSSPSARAIVDQLLRIIQDPRSDLLISAVRSIGCLARTFRATEKRIIAPLVRLLDETEIEVSIEAVTALIKFACTENFLHKERCRDIIENGGAKHLDQLVHFAYFEQVDLQVQAVKLLCYMAMHVPDNDALAKAEVLNVLEWATKQARLVQDPSVDALLKKAKSELQLYQSRGSRNVLH